MKNEQQRHDISDAVWSLLEPHLPGQRGQWGGIAQDNRRFINGVFWILRTGAPWRDLPPFYGKWGTVYQRFRRWRDKGIWEKLLEILVDEPDFEWFVPFPVSWTVKMKKKQKETQDILSYHTQAAGCSDKARAKASGGRQPIEECGRTGL